MFISWTSLPQWNVILSSTSPSLNPLPQSHLRSKNNLPLLLLSWTTMSNSKQRKFLTQKGYTKPSSIWLSGSAMIRPPGNLPSSWRTFWNLSTTSIRSARRNLDPITSLFNRHIITITHSHIYASGTYEDPIILSDTKDPLWASQELTRKREATVTN